MPKCFENRNQATLEIAAGNHADLDLIGHYSDAVAKGGPDCEEARAIREANRDDTGFREFADGFDNMKRLFCSRYRRLIPIPEVDYSAGLVALITGPPGSGKGTQAARIAREFGFLHLSVGDLLRAERQADTELGRRAASFMDAGELVPDDIIAEAVLSRLPDPLAGNEAKLCNALHSRAHDHELLRSILPGVLLDGFPRTVEQSLLLEGALQGRGHKVGLAVHLRVPDHEAVARMMGRGRSDDTEETVRRRLEVYYEQTVPLLDGLKDVLVEIDGSRDVDEVFGDVRRAVADRL